MKFTAALIAIVALMGTAEAGQKGVRYNGVSKDCTNTTFRYTKFAGKNCTGKKTTGTMKMPKC